jgi:hypothetical protein
MNTSSGDISGIQASGFMNNSGGSVRGAQLSGFMNNNSAEITGVQIGGFMNNTGGAFTGIQWAGFINNSGSSVRGVQASVFMNNSGGAVTGGQAASFMNIAGSGFTGFQCSGFLGIASGKSRGVQTSGFLNIAEDITGAQIGIVNFARRNSGASVGFFNIILEGIISPAVYIDTEGNAFIQYQGGTPIFYTTFLAGTGVDFSDDYEIYGFGVGTRLSAGKRISFDLELIVKQAFSVSELLEFDTNAQTEAEEEAEVERVMNYLGKRWMPSARLAVNYSFFRHLSVFAAANANFNIVGVNDEAFTFGTTASPIEITDGKLLMYPSFSAGIKF